MPVRSANHFKQKAQVLLCEMWTAGCLDEVCEGSTFPERSFVMGWPTCNCAAVFRYRRRKTVLLLITRVRRR